MHSRESAMRVKQAIAAAMTICSVGGTTSASAAEVHMYIALQGAKGLHHSCFKCAGPICPKLKLLRLMRTALEFLRLDVAGDVVDHQQNNPLGMVRGAETRSR